LGVWPLDQESCATLLKRVQDHLIKATREAMVHTRWTRPNQQHEDALVKFVARILAAQDNHEFLNAFRQFQKKVAYFGMVNSLSQTLLKIASPGVPDFYQGSELWDLRLVDPDNRGPIDFARRADALRLVSHAQKSDPAQSLRDLVDHWHDGRIKLFLIWKAIRFRRDHEDLFRNGEFVPLRSEGSHASNVSAFLRKHESSWALAAVPRWLSQMPTKGKRETDWGNTRLVLPNGSPSVWSDILTQARLAAKCEENEPCVMVSDLFRDFPVAFLTA
jgi:(1->4)-alpha-D-glucan 1-alpha-D-glucosylmutase